MMLVLVCELDLELVLGQEALEVTLLVQSLQQSMHFALMRLVCEIK